MEGIPDTGRFGFFIDRNPFSYIGFAGRKQNSEILQERLKSFQTPVTRSSEFKHNNVNGKSDKSSGGRVAASSWGLGMPAV